MVELTDLARPLIDRPLVQRPNLDALHARNRRRRRSARGLGGLSALVVIALVAALALTQLGDAPDRAPSAAGVHLAAYFRAGVSVPDATLAAVGLPASVEVPTKVTPVVATAASNSTVIYVGAEYCPYCAFQRWALLVALSKFGTFENLTDRVLSSSSDVYPDLASWSFVGARYTSPYFSFDPTELFSSTADSGGSYQALEKMSPAQRVAYDRLDARGGIPFVDIGNDYMTIGASASPSVLEGLSLEQIGASLSDPASPIGQAIDGSANYLIAAMCSMIAGATPAICSTATTTRALQTLDSGVPPTADDSSAPPPVQPPTDAPMSVWQRWSDEMHTYTENAAGSFRMTTPGCGVSSVEVGSTTYKTTTMGIPPGVKVWSISVSGHCDPKTLNSRGTR